jgi:hypothetical protein
MIVTEHFAGSLTPFDSGVRFANGTRQSNDVDTFSDEYVTKSVGVFRIAIENQMPLAAKEARGSLPGDTRSRPADGRLSNP